jgi:hypothetical protein
MTLQTATTEELLAELKRRLEHLPTPPKSRCEREFLRICEEHELDPARVRAKRRILGTFKRAVTKHLAIMGFTSAEIAEVMSRTPGAIKLRLHPKKRKP